MAFTKFMLQMFGRLHNELQIKAGDKQKSVLSLGYPDMLVSRELITEVFGGDLGERIPYHEDSDAILRWHSAQGFLEGIPDTRTFFEELGYTFKVVDIVEARGSEIILDLNYPIEEIHHQQYDVIIDGGTLEHCFNIAQAIKNVAECVAPGGYIINCNPFSCFNHGFYNLNPTFYFDFYLENGFEVVFHDLIIDAVRDPKLISVPATNRFVQGPIDASNILVAHRRKVQEIAWPIQTKYKKNSTLKG